MVQISESVWFGTLLVCCYNLFVKSSAHEDRDFKELHGLRTKRVNLIRTFTLGGAAYLRGEIVTAQLLRGAKEIQSPTGKEFKMFEKSGGFARAQKDFYSINPANVRVDEIVRGLKDWTVSTGYAGDRTIYLYSWNPQFQKPLISITHAYKRKGSEIISTVTEVIGYSD